MLAGLGENHPSVWPSCDSVEAPFVTEAGVKATAAGDFYRGLLQQS